MDNKKQIKLPVFAHSHEQVYFYMQELNKHLRGSQNKNIQEPLHSYLLAQSENNEITPGLVQDTLEFFKGVKVNAPRFNITLADYPEQDLRNKIVKWFRENIHEHSLLSFRYDKLLVGGIIVRGRNNIHDFSFKNKLQNTKVTPVNILENATKQTV